MGKFMVGQYEKRLKCGLILIIIVLFLTTSGYVFASLFHVPQVKVEKPKVLGSFIMALDVNHVEDLYAWQVIITFNSAKLKVLQVLPGDFLGVESPFFVNASDVGDGILLLGGTLSGDVSGLSGSGRLAVIIFGCFTESYEMPKLAPAVGCYETFLLNSSLLEIPIDESTLSLAIVE
ncbi:MAG: cohesin domain-containing protein [Nitrososphaerota archaeon]